MNRDYAQTHTYGPKHTGMQIRNRRLNPWHQIIHEKWLLQSELAHSENKTSIYTAFLRRHLISASEAHMKFKLDESLVQGLFPSNTSLLEQKEPLILEKLAGGLHYKL